MKRVFAGAILFAMTMLLATRGGIVQGQGTDHVVISEIQVGGGDAYDEFVELYNPTNSAISLSGWRLTKKTSTGTESYLVSSFPSEASIPAYGHYLITHPTGYDGSPAGDSVYTGSTYYIAADNTVLLYSDAGITLVDKVGMGSAVDYEVAAAQNPPNNQSIERKPGYPGGNGTDTDDNSADFFAQTTPNPQNSSSAPTSVRLAVFGARAPVGSRGEWPAVLALGVSVVASIVVRRRLRQQ